MKRIKLTALLLPLVFITAILYFSSPVLSTDKPQDTCERYIILTSEGGDECLSGQFTYCINGGPAMTTSATAFYVTLPCGQSSTVCLTSDGGCWGRVIISDPCPCADTYSILNIEPSPRACTCQ
jgi:hypothetical protein